MSPADKIARRRVELRARGVGERAAAVAVWGQLTHVERRVRLTVLRLDAKLWTNPEIAGSALDSMRRHGVCANDG